MLHKTMKSFVYFNGKFEKKKKIKSLFDTFSQSLTVIFILSFFELRHRIYLV